MGCCAVGSMTRHVVTFHYTLRDTRGQILDASLGGAPIRFLEGAGQIVEGLEEGLRGLAPGTKAYIGVPAAKGYGEHDETQVQRVLRALLPVEGEITPGDRFRAGDDAYAPIVRVVEVEGDELLLDANHPLAGVDLEFEVEIVETRPATEEELAHGHVHGEGGCCGGGGQEGGAEGGCCGGGGSEGGSGQGHEGGCGCKH